MQSKNHKKGHQNTTDINHTEPPNKSRVTQSSHSHKDYVTVSRTYVDNGAYAHILKISDL